MGVDRSLGDSGNDIEIVSLAVCKAATIDFRPVDEAEPLGEVSANFTIFAVATSAEFFEFAFAMDNDGFPESVVPAEFFLDAEIPPEDLIVARYFEDTKVVDGYVFEDGLGIADEQLADTVDIDAEEREARAATMC